MRWSFWDLTPDWGEETRRAPPLALHFDGVGNWGDWRIGVWRGF